MISSSSFTMVSKANKNDKGFLAERVYTVNVKYLICGSHCLGILRLDKLF